MSRTLTTTSEIELCISTKKKRFIEKEEHLKMLLIKYDPITKGCLQNIGTNSKIRIESENIFDNSIGLLNKMFQGLIRTSNQIPKEVDRWKFDDLIRFLNSRILQAEYAIKANGKSIPPELSVFDKEFSVPKTILNQVIDEMIPQEKWIKVSEKKTREKTVSFRSVADHLEQRVKELRSIVICFRDQDAKELTVLLENWMPAAMYAFRKGYIDGLKLPTGKSLENEVYNCLWALLSKTFERIECGQYVYSASIATYVGSNAMRSIYRKREQTKARKGFLSIDTFSEDYLTADSTLENELRKKELSNKLIDEIITWLRKKSWRMAEVLELAKNEKEQQEIAVILGISYSAVRKRFERAKKAVNNVWLRVYKKREL